MVVVSFNPRGRLVLLLTISLIAGLLVFIKYAPRPVSLNAFKPSASQSDFESLDDNGTERLHILLPASSEEVNLCKTIITASALDYPIPMLIAWNQTFENRGGLLGGGSHVAKITGVLEWLEAQPLHADDDLVLMMDAYDIWIQARKETLLSRYHSINAEANERLQRRLGRAFEVEELEQRVIFGAGKRCAPNQVHTVACYPIPESPLPEDVYGNNTDTIMGRNKYTSLRQRYLNSGYIIGPIRDLRLLFRRAQEKVDATKDVSDVDNGSHGSDFMYHGSDQSIFNIILGEQEFQREVMRRRHLSDEEKARGMMKVKETWIEGTLIDDPLSPSFTHESIKHKAGKPDEFGIGLDYFSELGQQTVNSEEDSRYIRHNIDIPEQIKGRTGLFDCPNRATDTLPEDIVRTKPPVAGSLSWEETPLYTNLCLNRIPVMIHHNGDKGLREYAWPKMWIQPHARQLMKSVLRDDSVVAHAQGGQELKWSELCPAHMEAGVV